MDYKQFKEAVEQALGTEEDEKYDLVKKHEFLDEILLSDRYHIMFGTEIYMNDLYMRYLSGEPMEQIIKDTKEKISEARIRHIKMSVINGRLLRNSGVIIFTLVNGSEPYLEDVPHRKFFDMAVVYRLVLYSGNSLIMESVIDNQMADEMDVTEEELYREAYENTKVVIKPEVVLEETNGKKRLTVKTRSDRFGAVCLLYLDIVNRMEEPGSDRGIYIWAYCEDDIYVAEATDLNYLVLSRFRDTGWNKGKPRSLSNTLLSYDRTKKVLIAAPEI